ncbi:hypothetical protein FZI85_24990 [Mycobacterium sp. CBMA293]|uniref:hypothetical protein n=1 Tax=unclassified Mycolicibacterium TaxID=2636767 RepID=UPI0012DBF4EA|nr:MULTISPECIES: hypothetical protein [unclassified Mycolicibacterium]MUL47573.1 hypothetical protein [Mycolicibacterium sp. CBMA 360]MUL61909.1 hypothetical protein [Mycolicibacterium sp. CBMA 335]MUL68982.1 hypothetical protein [Mycolicibacterium sp. CBMA 311]MUL92801.1 hypothetical protein [Mycolicibacterium sp. CBMA 230]MUM08757.1 hypothetical protein [Mycolicibacterium sp. CBMA 213]
MTDTIAYALAIAILLAITLAIRAASRRLVQADNERGVRDERIAELIRHHWVDADLPDRYTDQVIRCGGCDFTGPTRLDHARHIVAAIRRIDDADHRIAAQLHAMGYRGGGP